jgi:flavodoxin
MKTLVVYFSRTGQTTRVAKEIARQCDAHLDGIRPQNHEASWFADWRYSWQTLTHAEPPICRPTRNPANYDLVILGVPIARTGLAPPVRSYVRQYGDRIQHMALFCAEGTGIDDQGFSELSALYGKKPVATFGVSRKHLPTIAHRKQLIDFVDSIRGELSDDQSEPVTADSIAAQHASGMGWDQIANSLGLRFGDLVSAANHTAQAETARSNGQGASSQHADAGLGSGGGSGGRSGGSGGGSSGPGGPGGPGGGGGAGGGSGGGGRH